MLAAAVTATGIHGTDDLDSAGRHKERAGRFAATPRLSGTGFPVPGQFTWPSVRSYRGTNSGARTGGAAPAARGVVAEALAAAVRHDAPSQVALRCPGQLDARPVRLDYLRQPAERVPGVPRDTAHRGSDPRRRGGSPDPGRPATVRHQRPGAASVQPRPVTPGHTPSRASFLIRSQPFPLIVLYLPQRSPIPETRTAPGQGSSRSP